MWVNMACRYDVRDGDKRMLRINVQLLDSLVHYVGVFAFYFLMSCSDMFNISVGGWWNGVRAACVQEELWEGDICMTSMGPDAPPSPTISTDQHVSSLARKQEIFLDILSSQCAVSLQMEFLMNDKFEKALSPSELQLRDVVRDFEKNLKW